MLKIKIDFLFYGLNLRSQKIVRSSIELFGAKEINSERETDILKKNGYKKIFSYNILFGRWLFYYLWGSFILPHPTTCTT